MGRPPLAVGTYGAITTKRDGDRWHARAYFRDYDGQRREVARWATTRAAAERALKDAINDRTATTGGGDFTPDTRLRRIAEAWLVEVDAADLSPNTRELYHRAVDSYVLPGLGALRLREASVPALDRSLRAVREQHGPGAAKTARSVLSGLLGLAVRHGALSSNPVRDTSPVGGGPDHMARALTLDEEDRVRDAPRSSVRAVALDVPDFIDWMLGTGMRIGEACAVRDSVLDLDAGTVEVNATVVRVAGRGLVVKERPKSAAGWRVLALPDDLVLMLKRRRDELRLPGPDVVTMLDGRGRFRDERGVGIVFTSPTGRLRDPSNTQGDLREVLDAIDRPDDEPAGPFAWVTSHTFRKTVATRLDAAGLSARQIADVLGHKKPSMTQDVYMGRKVVSAEAASVLARPARSVPR